MNRALAGFCAAMAFQWAGGIAWAQTSDSAFGAPEQRQYLIMTVVQPPAAERLPIARSQPDLAAIANFIDTARTECADAPAAEPGDGDAPAGGGEGPAQ
jgi:hypothetical protein